MAFIAWKASNLLKNKIVFGRRNSYLLASNTLKKIMLINKIFPESLFWQGFQLL
jgi:hypothetical protein